MWQLHRPSQLLLNQVFNTNVSILVTLMSAIILANKLVVWLGNRYYSISLERIYLIIEYILLIFSSWDWNTKKLYDFFISLNLLTKINPVETSCDILVIYLNLLLIFVSIWLDNFLGMENAFIQAKEHRHYFERMRSIANNLLNDFPFFF